MAKFFRIALPFAVLLVPLAASAHEVYLLDPATIMRDIINPSPNPLALVLSEPGQFFLWALIGFIVVSTVFAMSITHVVERTFDPVLAKLKRFAAPIARITLGACLLASAYHNALCGPELPLTSFGALAPYLQAGMYVSGTLILLGIWTRMAALLAFLVFAAGIVHFNVYMLTYANYLGEIIFVGIVGAGRFSVQQLLGTRSAMSELARRLEPYAFPILRVLFGVSVAFASYFAKFLHSQLALDVVNDYHLTNYFHFDPLFVVLGAFCVEMLIGIFFIFGIEIRHTVLFFLFWLFLSLLYFGEAVWPHLVLLGVLVALFCHGYDRFSLEGRFFKKRHLEPVL